MITHHNHHHQRLRTHQWLASCAEFGFLLFGVAVACKVDCIFNNYDRIATSMRVCAFEGMIEQARTHTHTHNVDNVQPARQDKFGENDVREIQPMITNNSNVCMREEDGILEAMRIVSTRVELRKVGVADINTQIIEMSPHLNALQVHCEEVGRH